MPEVTANHIKLYYEERGTGKAVLFISGTGADLRVKPNVLDGPLPKTRRVIAYDQRGLGQSDKPEQDYSMDDYADDAVALVKSLEIEQVDVIGVSFGGMVALHLVLKYPEIVDNLVLCCTSPGGDYASYPFHELPDDLTPEQRLKKLMPVNDTRRDEIWQQQNPDMVEKMVEFTKAQAIDEHQTKAFRDGARRQLLARAKHDVQGSLGEIRARTLICAGKYDGIAPAENQHALQEGINGAELKWYEGGHLFMIQDKQAWVDILDFLAE